MRTLAAAVLAATAFAVPAAPASAEGCVEQYVLTTDDTLLDHPLVTLNPDGTITVYPNNVWPNVADQVAWARGFVDCVV